MNQDERYDELTYDQSYDFNQGYEVPEQAYAEADQVYAEAEPEAERRVPQAPPESEIYESAYDEGEEYDDDEEYVDDEEDFPEPGQKPAKGEKKAASPVVLAAGALGAVGVVGAMFFLDPLGLGLNEYTDPIVAMLPGAEPQAETPEDVPVESAEWQEPVPVEAAPEQAEAPPAAEPPPAAPAAPAAAKPKPPEPKPAEPVAAEPPAPVAAKPPAAKPKPPAAKPAAPKPAAVPQIKTAVAFAPNSAWVAAAEVEKLWAFSSRIQGSGGHLTVEGYAGSERDAYDLSRRRAEYVAQMLKKNNLGTDFTVTVKAMGQGAGPRVNVTYSSKL
ncbi:MAG: hypothetical protein ACLGIN_14315 [Candidatus Sericytochromatia bacterium]